MSTTRILIQVRYIYFYSTPEGNFSESFTWRFEGKQNKLFSWRNRHLVVCYDKRRGKNKRHSQNNSISWIKLFIQMILTIKEPAKKCFSSRPVACSLLDTVMYSFRKRSSLILKRLIVFWAFKYVAGRFSLVARRGILLLFLLLLFIII
jgi:hypothetical protein